LPSKKILVQNKVKTLEIANRLLNVLDEETISQTTGLSLEEVQKLKRDR
jgi:hypothetical protein